MINPPGLWILIGPVGAGKTTFARKLLLENQGSMIRVSMDDIIQMLTFYKYLEDLKILYRDHERLSILKGLALGYSVVIDRTNLTREIRKYFIDLAHRVKTATKELYDIYMFELSSLFMKEPREVYQVLEEHVKNAYSDDPVFEAALLSLLKEIISKDENLFGGPRITSPRKHLEKVSNLIIKGVWFDIPWEIALERREQDEVSRMLRESIEKINWKNIMEKMRAMFEPPLREEGFDFLYRIDLDGNMEELN